MTQFWPPFVVLGAPLTWKKVKDIAVAVAVYGFLYVQVQITSTRWYLQRILGGATSTVDIDVVAFHRPYTEQWTHPWFDVRLIYPELGPGFYTCYREVTK